MLCTHSCLYSASVRLWFQCIWVCRLFTTYYHRCVDAVEAALSSSSGLQPPSRTGFLPHIPLVTAMVINRSISQVIVINYSISQVMVTNHSISQVMVTNHSISQVMVINRSISQGMVIDYSISQVMVINYSISQGMVINHSIRQGMVINHSIISRSINQSAKSG